MNSSLLLPPLLPYLLAAALVCEAAAAPPPAAPPSGAKEKPAATGKPAAKGKAAAKAAKEAPPLKKALWLKHPTATASWDLRAGFEIPAEPVGATLAITADNGYELYLNGTRVGGDTRGSDAWHSVETYEVLPRLVRGANYVGVRATDSGGQRGVVAALRVTFRDREPLELVTNALWRATASAPPEDYSHPEYVEGPEWTGAVPAGRMGDAPWGDLTGGSAPARAREQVPAVALTPPGDGFRWPAGVVYVGDDCSTYVQERGDAWGVVFRVGGWTRAYTEFDLPCPSKIGRKLYALAPGPGASPRVILDAGPKGALGSPSVTFDGRAVLVALAKEGDAFFHIHRVPLDGSPPLALTDGPFHDIDPAELPDGRIVFTSTRLGSWEEYHQPPSRALFTMDADGGAIRPITFTPIFDNEPKVAADGSIVFIRSDNFFDRAKVETQLHSIRPDGTRGVTVAGANVGADYGSRLRRFGYGSPAPLPDGRLAFVSNQGNFVVVPGAPDSAAHRLPDGLAELAALPDGRLLATVLRPGARGAVSDLLAVVDPRDNSVVPVHESPGASIHSPVFLGARPRPPVLAEFVEPGASQPGATGFLLCENARFTTKTKAGWDNVRAVRILGARPVTVRSSHSHIVHIGHETVELGTVPLAADGSFHVEVPADMPLALQAVDAEGRSELNEMSWIYVRPGERRSCTGCHQPRESSPRPARQAGLAALLAPPLRALGEGEPHRFRGNNSGVTGMMDLQFERFRENASLNLHADDLAALLALLKSPDAPARMSAAQRLGLLRDRRAAPGLAGALADDDRETRVAAALALSSCGTRDSCGPLLVALGDADSAVAAAACLALENLTGHARPFDSSAPPQEREGQAGAWRAWLAANPWPSLEDALAARLDDPASRRRAAVALGHIGGETARAALRRFVTAESRTNPYPVFEKDNRTDRFTFDSDSPLNPRALQEAVRAIGHLGGPESVPFLAGLAAENCDPRTGNLFLAEAALEALGRSDPSAAEPALLDAFAGLREYWEYVGWFSDHNALYACHSSPLHARILHALDAAGSTKAAGIVPALLRSVPTDPDRALFLQNDDYETLAGRVVRRSGRAGEVVETCLALLGDEAAKPCPEIRAAIETTHRAWAGKPGPENRAAQVLSFVCRERSFEPRVRAAFERFLAMPEEPVERPLGHITWTPVRHWTLFYLGRTLGYLGDPASAAPLVAVLDDRLNEARHGRPDPAQPTVHLLHNDYTPCWRAAAAWALGRIGDAGATPVLLGALRNFDNAPDVRHAAAGALARMRDPAAADDLRALAEDYPEELTRRVLATAAGITGDPHANAETP